MLFAFTRNCILCDVAQSPPSSSPALNKSKPKSGRRLNDTGSRIADGSCSPAGPSRLCFELVTHSDLSPDASILRSRAIVLSE